MKPSILALLVTAVIIFCATSCHKPKHSTPLSTGNPIISGLTAVKLHARFDSGVAVTNPYITWHFSGTNPITAMPDTMAYDFGYQQLSFAGTQPAQLAYINMNGAPYTNYFGLTLNIVCTPAGLIDTITFQFPTPSLGAEKAVFQYNGSQVAKILVAHSTNLGSVDSFIWASPDVYTFTYTGNNISHTVAVSPLNEYSDSADYLPDTRKNNFAGSMTTFFQLEFLVQSTESLDLIWMDLPKYINANLVAETDVQNITDAEGRLTQRITNNGPSGYDTVFYYY